MKNMTRTLIAGLAVLLILFAIRQSFSGNGLDYISLGLGVATLIMVFIIKRKDQDGSP